MSMFGSGWGPCGLTLVTCVRLTRDMGGRMGSTFLCLQACGRRAARAPGAAAATSPAHPPPAAPPPPKRPTQPGPVGWRQASSHCCSCAEVLRCLPRCLVCFACGVVSPALNAAKMRSTPPCACRFVADGNWRGRVGCAQNVGATFECKCGVPWQRLLQSEEERARGAPRQLQCDGKQERGKIFCIARGSRMAQ
jgi:hypothetical protein